MSTDIPPVQHDSSEQIHIDAAGVIEELKDNGTHDSFRGHVEDFYRHRMLGEVSQSIVSRLWEALELNERKQCLTAQIGQLRSLLCVALGRVRHAS